MGDVTVTGKARLAVGSVELQTFLTVKSPLGDKEEGLGTGAWDLALTQKARTRVGRAVLTGMLGYTWRGDDAAIKGQRVDYGDAFAWMAAADAQVWLPRLWLGLGLSGLVQQATEIDGQSRHDRLATVDLTPEARYFVTERFAVAVGVLVPVATSYGIDGDDPRKPALRVGAFSQF